MMKNRIVAMLLAAVLVLSLVVVPAPVSAADEYTVRLADASGNSVVTAKAGDTVKLVLSIENNPGIIGVGIEVTYPAQISISTRPRDVSTFSDVADVSRVFSSSTTSNPYLMWWNLAYGDFDKKLVFEEGNVAEIVFKIADNATPGDYEITLAAPADKNTTASVGGDGVIIDDTNAEITNIVLFNCTIRVESDECDHEWSEWTDKPGEVADCDTPGKQIRECSVCHEIDEKDVPAKGHSFTQYTETSAATCIDNKKETATCDNGCGETDEREVANTATGQHSFQEPYISNNDATCTTDGTHYRMCSVCATEETPTQDVGSKLPHTFDQQNPDKKYEKTPATCGTPAVYYYSCSCGEKGTETFNYGTAAGHNFTRQEVTEEYKASGATCTAKATYYYSCSCGEKGTETFEYGEMLEHTYNQQKATAEYEATPASCTAKATYFYSCSCGAKGTETFTSGDFAPHVYDQEKATAAYEATPASCTAKATYFKSCVCGLKGTETFEYGEMLEHTYNQQKATAEFEATPASCTAKATYFYSCSCGAKGTETFASGDFAPHVYDQEKATAEYEATPASCTAKATYFKSCVCGLKGTETFDGDFAPHVYDQEKATAAYEATPASCTAKATYFYSCVCGAKGTETFAYGEMLEHTYNQQKATADFEATPATCTAKATYYKSCVCGAKGTETFVSGDFAPHTFDKEVANETYKASGATCTAKATYYKSCVCGAKGTETFASGETLPHTYDKEVATDAYKATGATCLVKATYYKSCVCGAKGTETFASGELAAHTFTVWTKIDDKEHKSICDVQGCLEEDKKDHSFSDKLTVGENTHWYACVCGEKKEEVKHTYDDKSWAHDDDTHWQACACGNKTVAAKHNWDEGEVTVKPSTKQEGEKTYTCKDCGATMSEKIPQTESPNSGDSFDVSLCIAVMLLAVLSMALVFVLRKKGNR